MYNPRTIVDLIAANVRKSGNPFGAPRSLINTWWKTASVPTEGKHLLFTGLMYQSLPYIERTTHYLEKYEDTAVMEYVRFGKYVPSFLAGLGLLFLASGREKRAANGILGDIARVLAKSRVSFYYAPRLDFYTGILLYDLGDLDGFTRHAGRVAQTLKDKGVTSIITVDPHSTYALKVLYPKFVGASFDVKTYFEMAQIKSTNGKGRVTIHDPCFYGRYLELSDVPVKLLSDLNFECVKVGNSGKFTSCCGGPAESVSPALTREILRQRVEELQATGAPIVSMCPLCLGNLRRAGADVEDLATLIARCA